MVSYSPSVSITPAAGDMVILTVGQSNDMFYGPLANTYPAGQCYFLNPRISTSPASWTLNQGRDALQSSPAGSGYILPSDTDPLMPPLTAGQHRGGSAWTWFMQFFASTPYVSRPATRLIIAQCGDHSLPSGQFIPGTTVHNRVIAVRDWFAAHGWPVTYMNVAQGESDAISMASGATYKNNWQAAIDGWRAAGIDCPIILDQNTLARLVSTVPGSASPGGPNLESLAPDWAARLARIRGEQTIRDAQASLWNNAGKVYRGVDADMIHNRIDGCHHSMDGQALLGYWRYVMLFGHIAAGRIAL